MGPSHPPEFKLPEDISFSQWSRTLLPTSARDVVLLPCCLSTLCTPPMPTLTTRDYNIDFCLFP